MEWRGGGSRESAFQTGLPSRRGIRGLSSSAVRNRITGWAAMAGNRGRAPGVESCIPAYAGIERQLWTGCGGDLVTVR